MVTLGQWFGIALPEGAKANRVKAELRNCVLTVTVPMPKHAVTAEGQSDESKDLRKSAMS